MQGCASRAQAPAETRGGETLAAGALPTKAWSADPEAQICAGLAREDDLVAARRRGEDVPERHDRAPARRPQREGTGPNALEALKAENADLRDLLRRQSAQIAQISQQETLLHSILDTGPDAMLVVDAGGLISRFSPAAERLFGWSQAEIAGRHVGLLMPESYPLRGGETATSHPAAARPVIGQTREVVGRRRDGSRFPMMLYVGEVRIGQALHFTKFVRDLTSVREADLKARQLHTQLTQVWGLNALGKMAAVLSHELNQPLAAISNYVEGARALFVRGQEPGEAEAEEEPLNAIDALDGARDQAIRAGDIIRSMRTLVAGKDTTWRSETPRALVRDLDFMVNLLARDGGAAILYDLAVSEERVVVDRIQIQQVLLNLVRNAVEAVRGAKTRAVEISCRAEAGHVVFSVEDSGSGVPPEVAERMFRPLSGSSSKEAGSGEGGGQGMGLGLSLSKVIVEQHRGRIWIGRSRWGGAAFSFSLPVSAAAANSAGTATSGVEAA